MAVHERIESADRGAVLVVDAMFRVFDAQHQAVTGEPDVGVQIRGELRGDVVHFLPALVRAQQQRRGRPTGVNRRAPVMTEPLSVNPEHVALSTRNRSPNA